MHENDQRAVARDVVGNRRSTVALQGPGAHHRVMPNAPSCQGAPDHPRELFGRRAFP